MNGVILKGAIKPVATLTGSVYSSLRLVGTASIAKTEKAETYGGAYNVIPKVSSQTMPTNSKLMKKDFVVEAIPFYKVDNLYDGQTVIIGE